MCVRFVRTKGGGRGDGGARPRPRPRPLQLRTRRERPACGTVGLSVGGTAGGEKGEGHRYAPQRKRVQHARGGSWALRARQARRRHTLLFRAHAAISGA